MLWGQDFMVLLAKKPYMRKHGRGKLQIVRGGYSTPTTSWYTIADEVRKRDGNKCVQCSSTEHLDVHHINPVSHGGRSVKSNLVTLCRKCHNKKHKHSF
jgi:5-methylcytosine-specific restriction endonuclease McrA